MKFTRTESCEGCSNICALQEYADSTTANEDRARRQTGAGTVAGQIACSGGIDNPVFGKFCEAKLTPSIVNEHADLTAEVCPAQTVEDIPGFNMFAERLR